MSNDPRLPSASDFAPETGFYVKEWDVPLVQAPGGLWFNWYGGKPVPFDVKYLRVDNNSLADSFEQWLEVVAASLKPRASDFAPSDEPPMGEVERMAREHLRLVAEADFGAVAANVTSDYINHRSADEPMDTRQRGPEALKATIRWLHRAFAEMRFEVREVAVSGNLAALYVTLHARQHGRFVVHDSPDGQITDVFPPTGRSFAARQIHWIKITNGRVSEHDAVRDDLGMAKQLGWIPPKPLYIARMLWARRQERRSQNR